MVGALKQVLTGGRRAACVFKNIMFALPKEKGKKKRKAHSHINEQKFHLTSHRAA